MSPALSGDDLHRGPDGRRSCARLSDATDLAVFHGSVVRLRLRDFDGRVVFSDDGTTDEAVLGDVRGFRWAAVGRTSAEVVTTASGTVMRVLRPVVASASGRPTASWSSTCRTTTSRRRSTARCGTPGPGCSSGWSLLYAMLAADRPGRTSRSLRRHAAQREHEALHDSLTGLPNRARSRSAPSARAPPRPSRPPSRSCCSTSTASRTSTTPRPPRRRRAAAGGRPPAARGGADRRHGRAARRRRVRPRPAGRAPTRRPPWTCCRACAPGWRRSCSSRAWRCRSRPASASRSCPRHGVDVEDLLQRADAAMYQGKRGGRPSCYAAPPVTAARRPRSPCSRAAPRDRARRAASCTTSPRSTAYGRTVTAWRRWSAGSTRSAACSRPVEFLPAVEQSGLIGPLTDWVLRAGAGRPGGWSAAGLDWAVAVNVSARNLEAPGFARRWRPAAERGAPRRPVGRSRSPRPRSPGTPTPSRRPSTRWPAAASPARRRLRHRLHQPLPAAVPPVRRGQDRPALRAPTWTATRRTAPWSRSVIDLAHGLGCRVTAEGVETAEAADWLRTAAATRPRATTWSRPAPWRSLAPSEPGRPRRRPPSPHMTP